MGDYRTLFIVGLTGLFLEACTASPGLVSCNGTDTACSNKPGVAYHLPRTIVSFKLERHTDGRLQITSTGKQTIPDSSKRYVIAHQRSSAADDTLSISLNKGMLEKLEFQSHERSGEVPVQIVKSAKEAIKLSFTPGAEVAAQATPGGWTVIFQGNIDITDRAQPGVESFKNAAEMEYSIQAGLSAGEKKLADILKPFAISYYRDEQVAANDGTASKTSCGHEKSTGIVYAHPKVVGLQFYDGKYDSNKAPLAEIITTAADTENLGSLNVCRYSLVEAKTEISFTDGLLSEVKTDQPSQAMAAAAIPGNILKEIISIPAEIIQLKFNVSSEKAKLYAKQQEELEAQRSLTEALAKEVEKLKEEKSGENDMPD